MQPEDFLQRAFHWSIGIHAGRKYSSASFGYSVSTMLHITDGESVAGTLRKSAIPGVVSTYGDLMAEGPAPAGLDLKAWIETRARFIADSHDTTLEEAR